MRRLDDILTPSAASAASTMQAGKLRTIAWQMLLVAIIVSWATMLLTAYVQLGHVDGVGTPGTMFTKDFARTPLLTVLGNGMRAFGIGALLGLAWGQTRWSLARGVHADHPT